MDPPSSHPDLTDSAPTNSAAGAPPVTRPAEPVDYPTLHRRHLRGYQRRRWLPLFLFVATCLSTFLAGTLDWIPSLYLPGFLTDAAYSAPEVRRKILFNWPQGVAYMSAILGILFFHEMGHFLATVLYRIPASFPFFIPVPVTPIGTMGAVIRMASNQANRRQMFDIGIAGPLAGLILAIPLLWLGLAELDVNQPHTGAFRLDCPWIVQLMLPWVRPDLPSLDYVWVGQVNSLFMAAWVGLLITGLNMMPVSQLDGGHVIYTLLLKRGHVVARGFIFVAIAYVVLAGATMWSVMIIIVCLMGTDHPPTSNDQLPLGWFRTILGYASLAIPVLCFPVGGIVTS